MTIVCTRVDVSSSGTLLHSIHANEFLDSPEWESSPLVASASTSSSAYLDRTSAPSMANTRFNVSLIASSQCKLICWQRTTLEYYLRKNSYMGFVLNMIVARDITNKLYAMNDQVGILPS